MYIYFTDIQLENRLLKLQISISRSYIASECVLSGFLMRY